MSIEQDIFDFNEPSEVAVLRALLDSGTHAQAMRMRRPRENAWER